MLKSYKWDGMGLGWDGRKSLKGVILRAPLCGANKDCGAVRISIKIKTIWWQKQNKDCGNVRISNKDFPFHRCSNDAWKDKR